MKLKTRYNDVPFVPCNDCSNWEDCREDAYQHGREDAIDEFLEKATEELYSYFDNDRWSDNRDAMWKIDELRELAEKLKEQKNE